MKQSGFLLLISVVLCSTNVFSQAKGTSYETALGVKFYPGTGITLKHFVKENAALEGIGYFWRDGIRVTGLYEFHGPIKGAPGLKWYAGPGLHITAWNNRWRNSFPTRRGASSVGIDGVLGLDYKFTNAPINMSLDWQPSYDFRYADFGGNWGGLSIRYTF